MSTRKVILLLALIGAMSLFVFLAGCGRGEEKPGATETAEAQRVLTTLTAEAQVTPTPSVDVKGAVRDVFEQWAQAQGEPYRDASVREEENDGYFATVQVVAWFRPDRMAPWEEREARVECRRVGAEWQCDQWFDFQLTAGELTRRVEARATAITQLLAQQDFYTVFTTNLVTDLLVQGDVVWTTTTGGVVRWDTRTGDYVIITTEHGLADRKVNSIAAAPDGALWFGTDGGVSRLGLDGRWQTFTTKDGLADNHVSAIAVALDEALWFGTYGGGVSRLGLDGRWQTFTTEDGLAGDYLRCIAVAPDGALWFGTEGGVSRLGPDGRWQTFTTDDGLAYNYVPAIAVAPDGALWFSTSGGVSRYQPQR